MGAYNPDSIGVTWVLQDFTISPRVVMTSEGLSLGIRWLKLKDACPLEISSHILTWIVFYLGIRWYPLHSKILSSFWGIVYYIRNIILLD